MTHSDSNISSTHDRPLTSELPYEVVHFLDIVTGALVRVIHDEHKYAATTTAIAVSKEKEGTNYV